MPGELGFDTGPFVNVAAFCERVLQEQDNVISLIRLIDQINVEAHGPGAPDELPPTNIPATLVVMLKAGQARGSQRAKITLEAPDGSRRDGPEIAVNFPGGAGSGANLLLPLTIGVESAGLYWADVHINNRLAARVPLQINYGFTRAPGSASPSSP
jgi:hypothetical protein